MHPITAALEQSMSPERIDNRKYLATHRVKPQGHYECDAIKVGGVYYTAFNGRKINVPVRVILHLQSRDVEYHEFHEHPEP